MKSLREIDLLDGHLDNFKSRCCTFVGLFFIYLFFFRDFAVQESNADKTTKFTPGVKILAFKDDVLLLHTLQMGTCLF